MNRKDLILGVLSVSNGASYSPVQIQKLFFLVDRNVGRALGGPFFNFLPYHYGPFDKALYFELDDLQRYNLVDINPELINKPRTFRLTVAGQQRGDQIATLIPPRVRDYVKEIDAFVRENTFEDLILAIYKAYPEMKEKSIFSS